MQNRASIIKRLFVYLVRYHFSVLLILVSVILALETFFLYQYFWRALAESKIVYELKQKAAFEELNMELYQRIKAFQEQKQKNPPYDTGSLRDPFIPQPER